MSNQTDNATRQPEKTPKQRKPFPRWAKITLRVLRILLVPTLCVIALFSGLIVGYVYIGGEDMADIWKIDTWKHVFDLMFKDT